MKFFAIDTAVNNEYKVYDIQTGIIFFILKETYGKYYTSELFEYKPIVEDIKEWLINVINNNPKIAVENLSFNYNEVIKPMFRQSILTKLGI